MPAENVVLITIDSLRADTFANAGDDVSPRLNALANERVEFSQAVSNGPNTPSSFPSILTGTHPLMYGGQHYLDRQRPFLSSTLAEAGFTTAGYHSNPHLGTDVNYNNGFDVFNDGGEERDNTNTIINFVDDRVDSDSLLYSVLRRGWHLIGSTTGVSAYDRAESITDDALRWLASWDGNRFFLWVHYMDVHYPFQPPKRFMRKTGQEPLSARRVAHLNDAMHENPEKLSQSDTEDLRALYRAELRYVDHNIGRILDALSERGVRDETMVVVTSDHGEAFGEHDRWGHHSFMYDELLRVPLIVDDPDHEPDKIDEQVSLIDLFPTICDSCGVKTPDEVQGRNLFDRKDEPVALGTSQRGRRLACRTPEWKCLWHVKGGKTELYDLRADPGETTDVSGDHPDVVERLRGKMESYREEAAATDTELPEVQESREVRERLKQLGYID